MNTTTKTSLKQEEWWNESILCGEILSKKTTKNVQNILERRPATREDIQDWFFRQWGHKKIQNLIKRLSIYMHVARYANRDLELPYVLPEDERELYRICTGSAPEHLEKIFHKIHNILSENKSDRLTWPMGRQELWEWYHTTDETGKTGKDYILEAMEDRFWNIWKDTVLQINKKRKLQNKGFLWGTIASIVKPTGRKVENLFDFFILLGETPNTSRDLAERYENILKRNQQEKPAKKTVVHCASPLISPTKNHEKVVPQRSVVGKREGVIPTNLKEWEIDIQEREDLWRRLKRIIKKGESKKDDLLKNFSQKTERISFSFFLRGLRHIGVPEELFTEKYIRFSLDEKWLGIIELHPIFFMEIGNDKLTILTEMVMGSIEQALSESDTWGMVLKIISM